MSTIDMTAVITKSAEYDNDIVKVNRALKRIASVKCRLKKMPARGNYNEVMTECLQEEQLLKDVRSYIIGPRSVVTNITQEDVDRMDYNEVCKSLHNIRSKKTHTRWAEDSLKDANGNFIPGTGESYLEACRIEHMLLRRRDEIKPTTKSFSKATLQYLLDELKTYSDLDAATCIARIESFMKGDVQ